MFDNFSLGDVIFSAVVTIGTALIVYLANRGRKE
jgi:hypothetical protein